jgi:hypothetical protein
MWGSPQLLYFVLGLVGALLTVYLARQVVIPEARPFIDIGPIEKEADDARGRIADIQNQLVGARAMLTAQPINSYYLTRVVRALELSLRDEQSRLDRNQRRILLNQLTSRLLGFLFFILLGGVFASLFTGLIKISLQTSTGATLPEPFQAVVIGAGWTGLLSIFGIRGIQTTAAASLDQMGKQSNERIDALQAALVGRIRAGQPAGPNPAAANPAAAPPTPAQMETWVVEESEQAKKDISSHLAKAHETLRHAV